jgi:CheY-like chemotaxis protein
VVILDIGLPQMDGYEVARRMREDPGLRDLKIVALTGYGQEEDRRLSKEAGFDHHMVKPVDFKTIQAILAPRGTESPAREETSAYRRTRQAPGQ